MKYKKIMILTIILAFLLAVSAVSAASNNATSDVVGADATDEVVSVENDNQVITEGNNSVGSFADLETEINNVEEGGVLNLTKDYKYVNESIYGIYISKSITIDGKGHTIDGNQISRIFHVGASKVVLMNINFANSCDYDYAGSIYSAGAIYWGGDDGALYNSTFINSTCGAIDWEDISCEGGAVYWYGKNGTLSGCSFVNCSALASDIAATGIGYWARGGAIYWYGDDGTLSECNFTNSTSCGYYEKERLYRCEAGAVYWYGKNGALSRCNFMNSFVSEDESGDIYWAGVNGILSDCSFINSLGGSISWYGSNGVLSNSSFYNCSSEKWSVLSWHGRNGLINKSYFSPSSNSINKGASGLNIIKLYSSSVSCENISYSYKNNVNMSAYISTVGKIIFNIFNENDSKMFIVDTTNEGIATLDEELTGLTIGTWNVTIIFEGNDNYAPCNATATITVLPASSSLTVDDINTTVGHEVTLVANVSSDLTVNEGFVSFFDGESNIGESPVSNGVATLTYAPSTAGEHNITAIFSSSNYLSSNGTAKLLVDSATIDVLVDQGVVGFNSSFVAEVKGLYSTINEGTVSFYINDEYIGCSPVVNGSASVDYVPLNANTYTVKAVFGDSDKFLVDEDSALYIVNPLNSTLTLDEIYTTLDYKTTLTAHVTSNNESVNGGTVTFYYGNESIGVSDVIDGIASFSFVPGVYEWSAYFSRWTQDYYNPIKCIPNFTAGNYTIHAIFNGENYLSSNATTNLLVDEALINIFTDNKTVGFNTTLSINVTRYFGIIESGIANLYVTTVRDADIMNFIEGRYWDFLSSVQITNGLASFNYVPLESGYHSLLVSLYNGILVSYKQINFNIAKTDSIVNVNNLKGTVCHDVNITATISSPNNLTINEGSVTFFDGATQIGESDVSNGIATLTYTPTTAGEHAIAAIFNSSNYLSSNGTANLFVNTILMNINMVNEIRVSTNTSVVVSLKDLNGKNIEEGFVSFYMESELLDNVSVENGLANLMFIPTTKGNYTISAIFEGNELYNKYNVSNILTITQGNTYLIVDDINASFNKGISISVDVVSDNGVVDQGSLIFYIDGIEFYCTPIVPGNGYAWYTPNVVGEHNITVKFDGCGLNYMDADKTIKLFVDAINIDLFAENTTVGIGIPIVAKITNLFNESINDGTVEFSIISDYVNETLGVVPVKNGIATLNYSSTIASGKVITAVYSGNDKYCDYYASYKFFVEKADSTIIINDMNGTVGHDMTITVNIASSNNLTIDEGYVVFFDGETNIGEANVTNGVARVSYMPTTAGNHSITAKYYSSNYKDAINSALLAVAKANIDLTIDKVDSVYFTNPSNFVVNINSNSKAVNEGKIKYYVNNEFVGMDDVKNGNSKLNHVTNGTGFFTLTVVYDETENYQSSNAISYFEVNRMPTTLTGESVIFNEEAQKTFATELKDNNNNGVNGKQVRIEVIKYSGESATFNGISDENGITVYDVGRLAGGMWYVSGIYAGDENYIDSRFADKFIVVRINTTTTIEEIDNPQVNHTYKLKANIHDENGKLVKEGILQFYLDGVDIGSIDLSKNQGHQNALSKGVLGAVNPIFGHELGANDDEVSDLFIEYIPTMAGKHTLTAVYEGTTIYKSSNSTTTFVVTEETNIGNNTETNTTGNITDNNTTVVKVSPELGVSVLDVDVGETVVVNVSINSKATGNVIVAFNGLDLLVSISNGEGSVRIPNLAKGDYTILAKYVGDDYFNADEMTVSFRVIEFQSPTNNTNTSTGNTNTTDGNTTGNETTNNSTNSSTVEPEIIIPPLDKPSDDGSVTIVLPIDATGKVTLSINGKNYSYLVEDGVATVFIPNLGDGDYPYTITYSGDSKYSSFTNNGSLKVNNTSVNPVENTTDTNNTGNVTGENTTDTNTTNATKPIPEIVIPPLDTPSSDGSVEISLPVDATGTVTLTINGKDYPFAIVNGKANVLVPNLGDGNYPYTITYSGDSKYSSFNSTGSLNVNNTAVNPSGNTTNTTGNTTTGNTTDTNATKPIPEVVVPPFDKPSDDGSVTITLPSDATGKVTLTINGKSYNYVVENGVANVIIPNLGDGDYPYTITYSGDSKYSSFTNNGNLKVNKILSTSIISSDVTAVYNGSGQLVITLKDETGKVIKGAEITGVLNGITSNLTTDNNGQAKLSTDGLDPNAYIATFKFEGTAQYEKSAGFAKVTVIKANSQVTLPNMKGSVAHRLNLTANVKSNNLAINEGTVTFYNGKTVLGVADVVDGVAILTYVPTKAGKLTIKAVYEGTARYVTSNATTSITVVSSKTKETIFTVPTVNTVYNGGKNLLVTLKDVFGKAVSGVKVKVTLNGKTSTLTTNKNGQVKVSTDKLIPKNYTAKLTFAGNSKYDKASGTAKVVVKKATPKITASAKAYKVKATKKYTVTLKDNKNKVIKNTNVKIKVNGVTYSAKTNTKGIATFTLKLNKKGIFASIITYAGSSYYNKVTKSVKITVK